MSEDFKTSVVLTAEQRAFHRRELARLRELAATITTKAVKARLAREAKEHARMLGLGDEHSGSE
jgi:hypothetical protein